MKKMGMTERDKRELNERRIKIGDCETISLNFSCDIRPKAEKWRREKEVEEMKNQFSAATAN